MVLRILALVDWQDGVALNRTKKFCRRGKFQEGKFLKNIMFIMHAKGLFIDGHQVLGNVNLQL